MKISDKKTNINLIINASQKGKNSSRQIYIKKGEASLFNDERNKMHHLNESFENKGCKNQNLVKSVHCILANDKAKLLRNFDKQLDKIDSQKHCKQNKKNYFSKIKTIDDKKFSSYDKNMLKEPQQIQKLKNNDSSTIQKDLGYYAIQQSVNRSHDLKSRKKNIMFSEKDENYKKCSKDFLCNLHEISKNNIEREESKIKFQISNNLNPFLTPKKIRKQNNFTKIIKTRKNFERLQKLKKLKLIREKTRNLFAFQRKKSTLIKKLKNIFEKNKTYDNQNNSKTILLESEKVIDSNKIRFIFSNKILNPNIISYSQMKTFENACKPLLHQTHFIKKIESQTLYDVNDKIQKIKSFQYFKSPQFNNKKKNNHNFFFTPK